MSVDQIIEHAGYVTDAVKLSGYRRALAEAVGPGDRVLDLGSGTGLLGLLALEAGAEVVYSVDAGSIIEIVEAAARANGYLGRLVPIRSHSTRLELDEKVDVIVCDQIGGGGHDSGILASYEDAARRLLAPGGHLIPYEYRVQLAPVQTQFWESNVGVWNRRPGGLDMSAMAHVAGNSEFRLHLNSESLLAPPVESTTVPTDSLAPYVATAHSTIERPGNLHGVAAMFVAQMSPGVTLSNVPGRTDRFDRWQSLYPLPQPVAVEPGHVVRSHIDIRPASDFACWSIAVTDADGNDVTKHRASTALGRFLTRADLDVTSGQAVPQPTPWLEAQRAALALVDGSRCLARIIDEVFAAHPRAFRDRTDAEQRLTSLVYRSIPGV